LANRLSLGDGRATRSFGLPEIEAFAFSIAQLLLPKQANGNLTDIEDSRMFMLGRR
jgi:hypothetical protein